MKKIFQAFSILIFVFLSLCPAFAAPKDTVVIAQGVDPSTLDPANHQETPAFNICLNIFDTLLVRDDQLKMQPLLATSYRLINENTWEFKLRQGVTFHNGEKFNAESVKYTLERMADPKNNHHATMQRCGVDQPGPTPASFNPGWALPTRNR